MLKLSQVALALPRKPAMPAAVKVPSVTLTSCTGKTVATFRLRTGVEEIFYVQVVPTRSLALSGPHPDVDGSPVVWVVPPVPAQSL